MSLTQEDIDFQRLLLLKDQDKLIKAMQQLIGQLQQKDEEEELGPVLQELKASIDGLIAASKEPKTAVKTGLGGETILYKAVEDLKKYIKMAQTKKEWEISFDRDKMGYIQSPIIFTQKQ